MPAPTRDGRLYLTGPRVQRTRIRALEIVQNQAPAKPSLACAAVADSLGEFTVNVSSIRQKFLEAFRLRSAHAASIDRAARAAIAARLVEEAWHGLPIGTLAHDGFEWRWSQTDSGLPVPPVIRQTLPGRLPPFVVSPLPEGWLKSVLHDRDERATLRSGRRYLSNITMAENADKLADLPLQAGSEKPVRAGPLQANG